MLYSGVRHRDKIEAAYKRFKEDPSSAEPAIKGLLGQYLLNEVLPSDINVNLKDKSVNYQLNDRLNLGLREQDDTTFLDLGWRF